MTQHNQQSQESRSTKIEQQAGDRAIQIGQAGSVTFQLLTPLSVTIILVVVLVVAAGLYYGYKASRKPAWMTGDFNIAVAEFGEVANEGIVPSDRAFQASKQLFDFLDSTYKTTDFGANIQVAHNKIGIINEDREAEQLAHAINANIVIYGSMFVDGKTVSISPKFYVREQYNVGELIGQHRLTIPIVFDLSSVNSQDINTELQLRSSILIYFTEGMIYLSSKNAEAAASAFQRSIREADKRGRFDGKETLYLFLSQAYTILGDFKHSSESIDRALALNPEYSRAYLARGNIYYTQAVQTSFDETKLAAALAEYKLAVTAKDQPEGAYVKEKANVSQGNIYVIQAQKTKDPELFVQAIYHYNQVVAQYEKSQNERIRDLAATAYFGLGAAYERQKNYAQAVHAYQQCINLTNDSDELRSRAEKQLAIVSGLDK